MQPKTTAIIALAAIVGLLANVITGLVVMKMAYGQEYNLTDDMQVVDVQTHVRYVVFLGFTDEEVAHERALYDRTFTDLPSGFAPALKDQNVQFVAAPHWTDPVNAYEYMLPALRQTNPDSTFVFVIDNARVDYSIAYELTLSLISNQTVYIERAPFGSTFVNQGFSIVKYNDSVINTIQHETLHLVDCGTWHDEDGVTFTDGHIDKYPSARKLPWCA